MQLSFAIRFLESYFPTTRHRKLRWREKESTENITIPELTRQEAPVALVCTHPFRYLWINERYGEKHRLEYNYWNGQLYVPCRLRAFMCLNGKRNRWAKPNDLYYYSRSPLKESIEEERQRLNNAIAQYVLIDGKVCEPIGEPRYVVMTFGLGGNHGVGWGTSISATNYYNPNIRKERYYRIDEEEKANKEGLEVALNRGDTKAEPHFKKRLYERFEILIPEAVKLNPHKEHGDGDPFMNRMDALTNMKNPAAAGLAIMALALN